MTHDREIIRTERLSKRPKRIGKEKGLKETSGDSYKSVLDRFEGLVFSQKDAINVMLETALDLAKMNGRLREENDRLNEENDRLKRELEILKNPQNQGIPD